MKLSKAGMVFFAVFIGLSVVQRMIDGAEFSTKYTISTLITSAIATVLFVVLLRLVGDK